MSGIAFADQTGAGLPELANEVWLDGNRAYRNQDETNPRNQAWRSSKHNVVEVLAFGDVDEDGWISLGGGIVQFSSGVPNDLALLGFALSTQGFGLGGVGVQLYNAYDLVIGT